MGGTDDMQGSRTPPRALTPRSTEGAAAHSSAEGFLRKITQLEEEAKASKDREEAVIKAERAIREAEQRAIQNEQRVLQLEGVIRELSEAQEKTEIPVCRKGHNMVKCVPGVDTNFSTHTCDTCRRISISDPDQIWRCFECDYDECEHCAGTKEMSPVSPIGTARSLKSLLDGAQVPASSASIGASQPLVDLLEADLTYLRKVEKEQSTRIQEQHMKNFQLEEKVMAMGKVERELLERMVALEKIEKELLERIVALEKVEKELLERIVQLEREAEKARAVEKEHLSQIGVLTSEKEKLSMELATTRALSESLEREKTELQVLLKAAKETEKALQETEKALRGQIAVLHDTVKSKDELIELQKKEFEEDKLTMQLAQQELQEELAKSAKSLVDAEKTIMECNEKIAKLNKDIDAAKAAEKDYLARIEKLSFELTESKQANKALELRISEKEGQLKAVQASEKELQGQVAGLQKSLQDSRQACEEQEKANEDLQAVVHKVKSEVKELTGQVSALEDTVKAGEKALAKTKQEARDAEEEHLARIQKLSSELTLSQQGEKAQDLRNNKLEDQVKKLSTVEKDLLMQVAALTQSSKDKDVQLQKMTDDVNQYSSQTEQLEGQVKRLSTAEKDLLMKVAALTQSSKDKDVQLQKKTDDITLYISQTEQLSTELGTARHATASQEQRCDELQNTIKEMKAAERELQGQLAGLQRSVQDKDMQLLKRADDSRVVEQDYLARIEKLSAEMTAAQQAASAQEQRNDEQLVQMKEMKAAERELQGQIAGVQMAVQEKDMQLLKRADDARAVEQDYLARIEKLSNELVKSQQAAEAQAQLSDEQQAQLKKEMKNAERDFQGQIAGLQKSVQDKEAQLKRGQDEARAMEADYVSQTKQLSSELSASQQATAAQEQRGDEQQRLIEQMKVAEKELQGQIAGMQKSVNEKEAEMQKAAEEFKAQDLGHLKRIEKLSYELTAASQAAQNQDSRNDKLQATLKDIGTSQTDFISQTAALQKTIEEKDQQLTKNTEEAQAAERGHLSRIAELSTELTASQQAAETQAQRNDELQVLLKETKKTEKQFAGVLLNEMQVLRSSMAKAGPEQMERLLSIESQVRGYHKDTLKNIADVQQSATSAHLRVSGLERRPVVALRYALTSGGTLPVYTPTTPEPGVYPPVERLESPRARTIQAITTGASVSTTPAPSMSGSVRIQPATVTTLQTPPAQVLTQYSPAPRVGM